MRISRKLVGLGIAVGMLAIPVTSASAAPNANACNGQTVSSWAQVGHDVDVNGIGGIAEFNGLSVEEVKEIRRSYCA